MFFMAGLHWFWIAGLVGVRLRRRSCWPIKFVPHVRARILHFIDPGQSGGVADTFQVDTALDSFISGGWFGKGPGEGTLKRILPDSHTDFIFAVTGEEFGLLFCMGIVAPVRLHRAARPAQGRATTKTRSAVSPRRASCCCSASRRRSTWRSICI